MFFGFLDDAEQKIKVDNFIVTAVLFLHFPWRIMNRKEKLQAHHEIWNLWNIFLNTLETFLMAHILKYAEANSNFI